MNVLWYFKENGDWKIYFRVIVIVLVIVKKNVKIIFNYEVYYEVCNECL